MPDFLASVESCRAGFEYSSISTSGQVSSPSATEVDAAAPKSSSTIPSSDSATDGADGSRRPSGDLLSGLLERQEIRSVSASTKDLPDFAAWLNLYAAGKWDPSRPSPFGEQDPSSSSSPSASTRSERSTSVGSSTEASCPGPEFLRFKNDGWLPPPKPPNEGARRRALYRHAIVADANPAGDFDKSFQRITRMAQRALGVAACVILLVEKDHLPVLASVGFEAKIYERESSFCGHTTLLDRPHVVLDTGKDWRINTTHPYVQGDTPIRFYAGTQLKTRDGFNLGTLCCIDTKPHDSFTDEETEMLLEYGELAMKEIELRMTKSHLSRIDKTSQALRMLTREVAEMGNLAAASDLPQVYESAADAVRRTLDIEGCAILDLSSFQLVKTQVASSSGARSSDYRYVPVEAVFSPSASKPGPAQTLAVLSMSERDPPIAVHPKCGDGYFEPMLDGGKLAQFLGAYPEGKMFDSTEKPLWTGYPCPTNVAFVYLVPILMPDQSPIALVCAYTCSKMQELLDPEVQFMQAVGGVVLSALLMRRVQEGDKVKAQFISNMSHELRTPLHGICGSTEILADSDLSPSQMVNLRAISTCASSLSSTIEHVLAFTKTTAQSLSGRRESFKSIDSKGVNLLAFLEETVATTYFAFLYGVRRHSAYSDIGDLYNANVVDEDGPATTNGFRSPVGPQQLQCLLDLQDRPGGWDILVDVIAFRRIIINLVGNALKYTVKGYVKISLSSPPSTAGDDRVPVQISILDTGKGMSDEFLHTFCFQPFAQEDTISPGTGLGLAITSNLVRSLGGRISVSSIQGRGSEFTVNLSLPPSEKAATPRPPPPFVNKLSIAFVGIPKSDKTLQLQRKLLKRSLDAWKVGIRSGPPEDGDLLIVDESAAPGTLLQYPNHRVLWITSDRQLSPVDPLVHVLLKPTGPLQLEQAIRKVLSAERPVADQIQGDRLRAEPTPAPLITLPRPTILSPGTPASLPLPSEPAAGAPSSRHRILHVEDNSVNRSVLRAFFKKKGVPLDEAVDGLKGAELFKGAPAGHYSIVLMDLSMPVLSGFQSVELIRAFEVAQRAVDPSFPRTPIFALTGSSSSEVQDRALSNGFDQFISKPVSLKELWLMLKELDYV